MSINRPYHRRTRKNFTKKQSSNSSTDLFYVDLNNTQPKQSNIQSPIISLRNSIKLRKFEQYFDSNKNKDQSNKKSFVNLGKLSQLPQFLFSDKNHNEKIDSYDTELMKKVIQERKKNQNNDSLNDKIQTNNFIGKQIPSNNELGSYRYHSQELRDTQHKKNSRHYRQAIRIRSKFGKETNLTTGFQQSIQVKIKKQLLNTQTMQNLINRINPQNAMSNKFFLDLILLTHSMLLQEKSIPVHYNIYIQGGNNHELVKRIARKRSGWRIVDTPEEANFIWTQKYKKSYLNKIKKPKQKTDQAFVTKNSAGTIKNAFNIQKIQPKNKGRANSVKIRSRNHYANHSKVKYETLSSEGNNNTTLDIQSVYKQFLIECEKITDKCKEKYEINQLSTYKIPATILMVNHLPGHRSLSDKKNLFENIVIYCTQNSQDPFQFLPFTIKVNSTKQFHQYRQRPNQKEKMWIVKPGQDSNRGRDIVVCKNWKQVQSQIAIRFQSLQQNKNNALANQMNKSVIIQQYILPLLYQQRKFDIRMYMLVTHFNKKLRAYLYEDGYLRTCSYKFSVTNDNCYAHLTNDAVQAKCSDYGKYEEGNKLPLKSLNKILVQKTKNNFCKNWENVWVQMKAICKTILEATKNKLTRDADEVKSTDAPKSKAIHFQLFGLDYMIDQNQKLWLIQVNTNPCLQTSQSRILNRVIPEMLDNALKIAVEPIMRTLNEKQATINNKFQVVYEQ